MIRLISPLAAPSVRSATANASEIIRGIDDYAWRGACEGATSISQDAQYSTSMGIDPARRLRPGVAMPLSPSFFFAKRTDETFHPCSPEDVTAPSLYRRS
jgi:hypothetical protein